MEIATDSAQLYGFFFGCTVVLDFVVLCCYFVSLHFPYEFAGDNILSTPYTKMQTNKLKPKNLLELTPQLTQTQQFEYHNCSIRFWTIKLDCI